MVYVELAVVEQAGKDEGVLQMGILDGVVQGVVDLEIVYQALPVD